MNPVKFDEANKIYTAPKSMPDCKELHTFQNDEQIISCWEMTPEEKISALFYGRVWLHVWGGAQPPVALQVAQSAFQYDEDLERDFDAERTQALNAFIERKAKLFITQKGDELPMLFQTRLDWDEVLGDFLKFALGIESVDQSTEKV